MTAVVCCTGMFAWTQSNLACNECSRACSGPREPTREPSNTPSPTGAPTLGPTSYPIRRKWLGPKRRSYKISSRGDVVAYHSSAAEHEWLDGQRTGKICSTANKPNQILAAVAWTNYSSGCWRPAGRPAPGPTNHVHLSHFLRRTGERELIEPLTGIARHPFARVTCENQSAPLETAPRDALDYLVLRNRCGDSGPKPRTLLFDLGASVGFRGVSGGMYEAAPDASASGTAPSLPLLYRLYEDRCLEPDDIFAWEPNMRFSATEWWGELPARLRAKVRLYNTYVEEGALADAADGAQGRPASFIHMLEAVAAPDHFVAVKVDIDTPDVELTIVETLAERPELAALVDELFFNTTFSSTASTLGPRGSRIFRARRSGNLPARRWRDNVRGDVDTAIGLLHRLRTLGIRAHFWI